MRRPGSLPNMRETVVSAMEGDHIEFAVVNADKRCKGTIVEIEHGNFVAHSVIKVWTDEFGGMLVMLPLVQQPFFRGPWTLIERPKTSYAAMHAKLKAINKIRAKERQEEIRQAHERHLAEKAAARQAEEKKTRSRK